MKCRVCTCTDDRACESGCEWAEPDLCSNCAETIITVTDWLFSAVRPAIYRMIAEARKPVLRERAKRKAARAGAQA